MRWFPHESDSYEHPKIKKLRKLFGHLGVAVYWQTLEIISRYGGRALRLSLKKYDVAQISDDFKVSSEDLLKVWEEMMKMNSLSKALFKKEILYSSKLKERPDEYTKRVWREARQDTDKIRRVSANNTIHNNTIYNNTIHKNHSLNKSLKDERRQLGDKMSFPK